MSNNSEKNRIPDSGFKETIEDIAKQRKAESEKEKKEKITHTVETSVDDGKTWSVVGEYDDENEAVSKKREIDHAITGLSIDVRVGKKE